MRFRISRESAKYFLARVQKSFKTETPPHHLILKFMEERNFEALPRPYDVARLMNHTEVWPYSLQTEPPTLLGEEDVYVD